MRDATGRMLHSTIGRRREEICSQISRLLDKAHIHLNVLSCFCWWWWWRKHPQHYSWIPELDTKSNTGSDTFPIPLLSFIHSFDRFLRLVSSTHTHTYTPASFASHFFVLSCMRMPGTKTDSSCLPSSIYHLIVPNQRDEECVRPQDSPHHRRVPLCQMCTRVPLPPTEPIPIELRQSLIFQPTIPFEDLASTRIFSQSQ